MTRKFTLLFVVIITFVLTIGEGFFGTQGYFVNQGLVRALAAQQLLRDGMALEVESLQKRLDTVWNEDELRDNALKLGYSVAKDTVFHFSEPQHTMEDDSISSKVSNSTPTVPRFKGISFWPLLIISTVVALILSLGISWDVLKFRGNKEGLREKEGKDN